MDSPPGGHLLHQRLPPRALIRRADEVEYEAVGAADGMHKGVLVGEEHGAPNLAIRRFTLDPGASVPRHTNEVEHEQYVLEGEYVVGIDDEEYTVGSGDAVHIPAGTVHWYRNEARIRSDESWTAPSGRFSSLR